MKIELPKQYTVRTTPDNWPELPDLPLDIDRQTFIAWCVEAGRILDERADLRAARKDT